MIAFRILCFIIQHIDTLPKYGHKTLDVRRSTWCISSDGLIFAFLRKVKMTAACNFISLREKMRELLDKNGTRKKKEKKRKKGKLLIT